MIAPYDPTRIRRGLPESTDRWLASLEVFESISSTNSYLLAKAAREHVDGHVCIAEYQTAGRGRRGRSWVSPRGGSIAMSLTHRVAVPLARLGAMSLVTGVGAALALDRSGVSGVGLKWPNDLYLAGAKLGGILIEVVPAVQPPLTVIGIGLNLERGAAELAALADPIAAVGDIAGPDRDELCAALIDCIHSHVLRFETEGFAPFRAEFGRRDVYAGRAVTVAAGLETVTGVVAGVGEDGELLLETGSGPRRIGSGEVTLRPLAPPADLPRP
jgi:BirA family biotin operon repressor/biotin-[acetyl-CoA-carboxylase] ligase